MPMTPRVIFSLGATLPARPRTWAGMNVATDAAATVFRTNSRRVVFANVLMPHLPEKGGFLMSQGKVYRPGTLDGRNFHRNGASLKRSGPAVAADDQREDWRRCTGTRCASPV